MNGPRTDSIIRFADTSKFFGAFQALKTINLEVFQGERIVICGPSGSGKSTLIRCINGLECAEEGTLEVDGIRLGVDRSGLDQIRRRVGMVFQNFNLFPHLSVIDNLTLGPVRSRKMNRAEARDLAMQYLERVRIPEQADKFPRELSGGQQQRVAIARSLCMNPRIMLFDEPTSALDAEMINEVLDVMVELAATGMTMLCVTHEMGFARKVADRIIFMDHGEIVEIAEPQTFFTAPTSTRCRDFLDMILHHDPS